MMEKILKWLRTLIIAIVAYFAISLISKCNTKNGEVEPGEMKYIPFTSNYAIGTDSTIVIIDRDNGKTLNVIKRK